MFRAPLLRVRDSNWQHWNGQLFAHFSRVDVSRLRHHADVGIDVARGRVPCGPGPMCSAARSWAARPTWRWPTHATLGAGLQALQLPPSKAAWGRRPQGL